MDLSPIGAGRNPRELPGGRNGHFLRPLEELELRFASRARHRQIAGQFLAAEALWALEEQGMLDGIPAGEKLDLPKGWSKDPKEIRQKLVDAGAHNLGEAAIATYREIKSAWDATASPA